MADIKENVLRPYTIVTGQDVEKFEQGVNHLLELGYVPYGNVQTSSVLGKGDIITVYTQVMIEGGCDCEDEECSCKETKTVEQDKTTDTETPSADENEVDEEPKTKVKELLVEPANETKKAKKGKK